MMTSVDVNGTTTSKTISLSQSAIDDLLSLGLGMPLEPVQQQQHQSTSLLDNLRCGHASDSWTPVDATTSDTCEFSYQKKFFVLSTLNDHGLGVGNFLSQNL